MVSEIFASDSRSHADIEVFRVIVGDGVHLGHVEADAAEEGRNSGLETSAGSVRDDGNVFGVAQFADLKIVTTVL